MHCDKHACEVYACVSTLVFAVTVVSRKVYWKVVGTELGTRHMGRNYLA